MVEYRLRNARVAAIVTDGFEQIELTSPAQALEDQGAQVDIISPSEPDGSKKNQVQGWNHDRPADMFSVDIPLDEANPADYDAVLLPGGVMNGDKLRVSPTAQDFLRYMNEQEKPVFVICHGPWTMISAGIVKGRVMTSYHTLKDDLINAGAKWVDEPVVNDDNFISSRGPDDIPKFNEAIINKLAEYGSDQEYAGTQQTIIFEEE